MLTKYSYGIGICRKNLNTNQCEILCVKKRYNYAFFEFVWHRFNKKDTSRLLQLFNGMTHQEKDDILTLKFEVMWRRVMLYLPGENKAESRDNPENMYQKKKTKFEKVFLADGGEYLKKLINGTRNCQTSWEIPKGRAKNEKYLDAAIREIREETGIPRDKYNVFMHQNCVRTSYIIHKTRFIDTYYIAEIIDPNFEPKYNYNSYEQRIETESIGWVTLASLEILNKGQFMSARVLDVTRRILRAFKVANKCIIY